MGKGSSDGEQLVVEVGPMAGTGHRRLQEKYQVFY